MNRFDWQSRLKEKVYSVFPEAERRPVIGITGNYGEGTAKLADTYYKSVLAAGGVPLIIPPVSDESVIINTLDSIDGLLLSGGGDYNPLYCGEQPSTKLHSINSERDLPELLITRLAYNRQIPMLGICRGIQTMAMALDGHVKQDISDVATVKHSQDADRSEPTHTVCISPDSLLRTLYNKEELAVNSFHHQALSDAGPHFRVVAISADGIIEAIESSEHKPMMGVQWHPECLEDGAPLFKWLVAEAARHNEACRLHNRIITLDSHCDTPMLFPHDVNFATREPKLLVDLHKMADGRQDATIMVAYVPQPKPGEPFGCPLDDCAIKGPADYADEIFNRIENIVADNSAHLALARNGSDLLANKQAGKKSIMLGIENGLALEGSIERLRHFAERGIVYMTLCHNGDNDICDSARGCRSHGGVSAFGSEVIKEMNRLGVLVDLSHASEDSFYDAMEISRSPIVCSHSSCRSLCDHPRNLTDEQMRRLAQKGGVMQVTLYNGFLKKDGQATILDAMNHLEHAISVMGIDHVGIGTDFDGDGGICGLADSSELINFTRMLLARRYSEEDIQKIWGGNFLRLMAP